MPSRRILTIAAVAIAVVSASLGFTLGNHRAAALERYLEQVVLEHEGLRAVMAEQAYHLDRLTDSRAAADGDEVGRLRVQLDQATLSLTEARSVSEARLKDIEARDGALVAKDDALGQCTGVQANLEQQLERCIFQKAALERSAARAASVDDVRPRSGVSDVSETVTYPGGAPPSRRQ